MFTSENSKKFDFKRIIEPEEKDEIELQEYKDKRDDIHNEDK
jgi:hypothetical protein